MQHSCLPQALEVKRVPEQLCTDEHCPVIDWLNPAEHCRPFAIDISDDTNSMIIRQVIFVFGYTSYTGMIECECVENIYKDENSIYAKEFIRKTDCITEK